MFSNKEPLRIPVTEAPSAARPVLQIHTEWRVSLSAGDCSVGGNYWADIEAEGASRPATFSIDIGTDRQSRSREVRAMHLQTSGFPTVDAAIRQTAVLLSTLIQKDRATLQEVLEEVARAEKEHADTIEDDR